MNNLIKKIKFWYKNSRPYTIPITFLSWLVIFVYSLKHGGNIINGIIAYFGIALVHLATNLSDDYLDYKRLIKNGDFSKEEKASKCQYLKSGQATISDLRNVIIIMLLVAASLGGILFITAGWKVILFAFAVLPIALFYSVLSSRGLGDIAVIIAYGPLMFEGVYYVMTKSLSLEVLILSLGCSVFVNSILYAHMLMDFDGDVASGKTTLCTRLGSKQKALYGLMFFYAAGYLLIGSMALNTKNYLLFATYMTLPLTIDLYKMMKLYNKDASSIPKIYPWHYPLDNWESIKNTVVAPFFIRFFYVRNISTYFMLLTAMAVLLF